MKQTLLALFLILVSACHQNSKPVKKIEIKNDKTIEKKEIVNDKIIKKSEIIFDSSTQTYLYIKDSSKVTGTLVTTEQMFFKDDSITRKIEIVDGIPMQISDYHISNMGLVGKIIFKKGKSIGTYEEYYPSGKLKSKIKIENGIPYGLFYEFYESGELKSTINLENGKYHGVATFLSEGSPSLGKKGLPVKEVVYENGKVINTHEYDEKGVKIQVQDPNKKAEKEIVGVFIQNPMNDASRVMISEKELRQRRKINDIITGNLCKDFHKKTPLQQKNYLSTEEGKNKLAQMKKDQDMLFNTTWCFVIKPKDDTHYNLELKKMMISLGFFEKDGTYCGHKLKFKDDVLYVTSGGVFESYSIGIDCSENLALKIENNISQCVIYIYFKVPSIKSITNMREISGWNSSPELSVNIDRVELRNKNTKEIYLSK